MSITDFTVNYRNLFNSLLLTSDSAYNLYKYADNKYRKTKLLTYVHGFAELLQFDNTWLVPNLSKLVLAQYIFSK